MILLLKKMILFTKYVLKYKWWMTCNQLADACSNIINNQAFATYQGIINPNFTITDDPSLSTNTGCLITPQATNFLADL